MKEPKICKICKQPYIPYRITTLISPICQDCIEKAIKQEILLRKEYKENEGEE